MVDKFKSAMRKNQRRAEYQKSTDKLNATVADKEAIVDAVKRKRAKRLLFDANLENWMPKTELGKKVKDGTIKDLNEIFDRNLKIMEPEIIDFFVRDIREKLMDTTKTSYVRMAGRKYNYRCCVLIGDGNSFLGFGIGKDKDKWNSATKAARLARLNLTRVKRGCGSWECLCGTEHTVPVDVEGKAGSVRIKLSPAPLGTGLVVTEIVKPVLEFAGVKDVWSRTTGQTSTKINMIQACIDALRKTYKKERN